MLNKIDNHLLSHSNSKRCFVFLLETMKILSTKHKDRVSVPYTYHLQVADTPYFQLLLRFLKYWYMIYRPKGRNFHMGVRRLPLRVAHLASQGATLRQGAWGPLKAPRSPWVFGAKSCNLAISNIRLFSCIRWFFCIIGNKIRAKLRPKNLM